MNKNKFLCMSVFCLLSVSALAACGGQPSTSAQTSGGSDTSATPTSETTSGSYVPPSRSSHEPKDEYTFIYNYNYPGCPDPIEITIEAGRRASNRKVTRAGYDFLGWYYEPECIAKFDFTQKIEDDWEVFAGWQKQAVKYDVTFNFNYGLRPKTSTVKIAEGSFIKASDIPACPRIGKVYEDWYTAPECEPEDYFDIESTPITENITLYAAYEDDPEVKRDASGELDIRGQVIDVAVDGTNFGINDKVITGRARAFQNQYGVTINIWVYNNDHPLPDQDSYVLRFQQTPGKVNQNYTAYYPIEDIFDFIDSDINFATDFCEGTFQENWVDGELRSVPMAYVTNWMMYNKNLVNPEALPTNLTQMKAAINAALGKGAKYGVYSGGGWDWKEGGSMGPFYQNDAAYYLYDNEKLAYDTKWMGETAQNAKDAIKNSWDLLGFFSDYKGYVEADKYATDVKNKVESGEAAFGLISGSFDFGSVVNSTKIGIMPLSGLFTDNTDEASQRISCHSFSVGFHIPDGKYPIMQMAAAAKFANFVLEDCAQDIVNQGYWPTLKTEFDDLVFTSTVAKGLKQAVPDPEKLYCLPGHISEWTLYNKQISEGILVNGLYQAPYMEETDIDQYYSDILDMIRASIGL